MTNQEFDAVQAEMAEYVRSTSFGTPDDDADGAYLAHAAHAEYGATEH